MSDRHDDPPLDRHAAAELLRHAREVRAHAYAPYSGFAVGAALLAETGEIFTGTNVENASFGLTSCAERSAIGRAVSDGVRRFRAIAVVGPETVASCPPCGSCRQVLHEFAPDLLVVTPGEEGEGPRVQPLGELLPGAFGGVGVRRQGESA